MPTDTVKQIKDKISILEVVTPYVKLTRAGKYYRGLSPFGKEKTPSFYVNPERGSYYCFSTTQGGDQFTFIEKMEGVDFKGALKILAEKAGVEIIASRPEEIGVRDKIEKLRQATAKAEFFYVENLSKESEAYRYALSRGLTQESITSWNLGYAQDGWRILLEKLATEGLSPKELAEAGLIKEADEKPGTYYDRFRNRLMFPIADTAGRTVAFTGRALDPADGAKYLNSPETDVFKKSEILFGMNRAKDAIRARGFAILVEGQFDLLLLHQAGFQNTIALSGTALSGKHIELIKRYADNLMLCLDGDRAGLRASAKTAHAALLSGMKVKAVELPHGKDPADVVSEDPKVFTSLVGSAKSIVEFFISILSREDGNEQKLLERVEAIVLPLVVAVQSPLEQNRLVESIARTLGSTPEAVRASLPATTELRKETVYDEKNESVSRGSGTLSSLQTRRELVLSTIKSYEGTELAKRLISEYSRIISLTHEEAMAHINEEPVSERALFESGLALGENPEASSGDDILRMFEIAFLVEEHKKVTQDLRRAEAVNDTEGILQATKVLSELSVRRAKLS